MRKPAKQIEALDSCSDEDLLDYLQAGQVDVFGELVRRYEKELFGYLRRYVGDDAMAEDVFQNTFLQVYKKCKQYQKGRPVKPWLYTVATHQAIDAMRRAGRRATISLDQVREADADGEQHSLLEFMEAAGTDPLDKLQVDERRELVRATIDNLPEHLKSTVLLAYYQGLKYREIADILDIPVGTVKSRLHVALHRLQEAWSASDTLREEV